jgi:hypothetical protein
MNLIGFKNENARFCVRAVSGVTERRPFHSRTVSLKLNIHNAIKRACWKTFLICHLSELHTIYLLDVSVRRCTLSDVEDKSRVMKNLSFRIENVRLRLTFQSCHCQQDLLTLGVY